MACIGGEKMLSAKEIQNLISDDSNSEKKRHARKAQLYYDSEHDIKQYRLFYYNADGKLVEDLSRSNVKICHPFFAELVDQAVQYILSCDDMIKSDIPELQSELDAYFNSSESFTSELSDLLTGCMVKGYEFMAAYKNDENRLCFKCADSLCVTEVRKSDTDKNAEYVIYTYSERVRNKKITRIQVWDKEHVYFFVQTENGAVEKDSSEKLNPRPHLLYMDNGTTCYDSFGFIPFFRLDNNKKQYSSLKTIKDLIDDYDLMASSLSNNLIDFDTPIHVVKGFEGA